MKNALIILALSSLLAACNGSSSHKTPTQNTSTVKTTRLHKTLFFTGTLQPLHESPLTSPVDAVVECIPGVVIPGRGAKTALVLIPVPANAAARLRT